MMRIITGEKYNTSFGTMVVLPMLTDGFHVGDQIEYDGIKYVVKKIIPPTKPDGKWSIMIE